MSIFPSFSFTVLDKQGFDALGDQNCKDCLLQWNLDRSLIIKRIRFSGNINPSSVSDYERLLKAFLTSDEFLGSFDVHKSSSSSSTNTSVARFEPLNLSVLNMSFFDRLNTASSVASAAGTIRGCMEETFNGVIVRDLLREFLANEDSENAGLFKEAEKKEVIFQIFRILALGGSMCQEDPTTTRYLDITKILYKDCVTVFRNPEVEGIHISGRAFTVQSVEGVELFSVSDHAANALIVIIDPLKKTLTVIKNTVKSFW